MFIFGQYERKELRTGTRDVVKAPGVCTIKRRVNGRMRVVGAVLPGVGPLRVKIGRP